MTFQAQRSPANLKGRRILWVDDHPENNTRIVELLRKRGAIVELAESGKAALSVLHSFAPDLLLSDVGRGGDSGAGFDDVGAYREEKIFTGPVIFYSGRVSNSMRERASQLGAQVVATERDLLRAIAELPEPSTPVAA